ncbi:unnamed protein product, partial [Pocillopora meandrina]
MATTNITGPQTKTFERLICSPVWEVDLKQHSISFSAVNILLSITATLANSLILVALHKESSLHLPSKLLYRCLATSDLLVGVVNHPLYAAYWMSLAHEHWSLCRYARNAGYISSFTLCGVSLFTTAAISVDRLLAMLLGLRYKEILALVVCYVPKFTVEIVIFLSATRFSNFFLIYGMANVLVFFNSTLNPFLYCWKISEVRRAVKQTIRQAIC